MGEYGGVHVGEYGVCMWGSIGCARVCMWVSIGCACG